MQYFAFRTINLSSGQKLKDGNELFVDFIKSVKLIKQHFNLHQ